MLDGIACGCAASGGVDDDDVGGRILQNVVELLGIIRDFHFGFEQLGVTRKLFHRVPDASTQPGGGHNWLSTLKIIELR